MFLKRNTFSECVAFRSRFRATAPRHFKRAASDVPCSAARRSRPGPRLHRGMSARPLSSSRPRAPARCADKDGRALIAVSKPRNRLSVVNEESDAHVAPGVFRGPSGHVTHERPRLRVVTAARSRPRGGSITGLTVSLPHNLLLPRCKRTSRKYTGRRDTYADPRRADRRVSEAPIAKHNRKHVRRETHRDRCFAILKIPKIIINNFNGTRVVSLRKIYDRARSFLQRAFLRILVL